MEHTDFFAPGFTFSAVSQAGVERVALPHRWFRGREGMSHSHVIRHESSNTTTDSVPNSHVRLTMHPENKFTMLAWLGAEWLVVELSFNGTMVSPQDQKYH